jgi:fructose-bisphosphate aldolase class II
VPDDGLRRAVAGGIAKVNIGTQLNKAFTAAVREYLGADPKAVDPRTYLGAARTAVAGEVARLLAVLRP